LQEDLKLYFLSIAEVSTTCSLEFKKLVHITWGSKGEDNYLCSTDADVRKYGEQKGLETPVVHTVKYEY
jgi:general stress protein 26